MTVREKILELSSLPSGHSVREHLLSMSPSSFIDCTDAISLAIFNYKNEIEVREEIKEPTRLIVVQDGRAPSLADGEIGGDISGDINTSDIIATMDKKISGSVKSGSTSGSIGGSISGKVKK